MCWFCDFDPDERKIKDILIKEGSIRKLYYVRKVMGSCLPKDDSDSNERELCLRRFLNARRWGLSVILDEQRKLKRKYNCLLYVDLGEYLFDDIDWYAIGLLREHFNMGAKRDYEIRQMDREAHVSYCEF